WTYLRGGRGANPFTFEMGVSAANYKAARAGLEEALAALVKDGVTAKGLDDAKAETIQRLALSQETSVEQASLLAFYEAIGLGWERLDRLPDLYRAATLAQVNAAIKRHLDPARLRVAVVGDLKAAGVAGSGATSGRGAKR
ncbi:MAG: M16 family metallopeptidase, partial [Polyangiaceae bacterium]